jgi:hypothetical protein
MTPYFCDGLKDVTILNGAARLEFHRLLPGADGEMQVASEVLVALPTQGLVQMLSVLEQVRDRLIRENLLEVEPAADHPQGESQTSPNFA